MESAPKDGCKLAAVIVTLFVQEHAMRNMTKAVLNTERGKISPPPHTLNRSFIVSISKAAFTVMQRYASSQWIKSIITTQGIVFSLSRSLPFCVPHVSHVSIPKGGNAYDARSRLSRMISISLFRLHPFLSLSISSLLSFSIIFRLVLPFRCLYLGFAIEMV